MLKENNIPDMVCFGEVLWDVLPSGEVPGGAPMNVAYHFQKMNHSSSMITKIGLDERGKKLVDILSANNISTEQFQIDYDHDTGVVYANLNDANEVMYDIKYPSAWDFINSDASFRKIIDGASFFVYGSLAARNYVSRNTLLGLLETSTKKVLDINLRPPHYSRKVIEELIRSADILKMNLSELELITGWFSKYNSIEERIKIVQDKFRIPIIVITMGDRGAVMNSNGVIHRHNGFTVDVVDTIGSGDAFLAGLLSSFLRKVDPDNAIKFAGALGALVATRKGGCPNYTLSDLEVILNSTNIKSV